MTRVFVDRFGGGETAAQLRDMIISSLGQSRLVQITENEERADVVLRGSGEDLVFTDQHQFADGLNVHANSAKQLAQHLERGRRPEPESVWVRTNQEKPRNGDMKPPPRSVW